MRPIDVVVLLFWGMVAFAIGFGIAHILVVLL